MEQGGKELMNQWLNHDAAAMISIGKGTVRPKKHFCLGLLEKNEGGFRQFNAEDKHFVKHYTVKTQSRQTLSLD